MPEDRRKRVTEIVSKVFAKRYNLKRDASLREIRLGRPDLGKQPTPGVLVHGDATFVKSKPLLRDFHAFDRHAVHFGEFRVPGTHLGDQFSERASVWFRKNLRRSQLI